MGLISMLDKDEPSSTIEIVLAIAFILMVLVIITYLVISTIALYEYKSIIKDCNKDFGEGQWTFIETDDAIICRGYNMSHQVTQTKTCTENGIKVNCTW